MPRRTSKAALKRFGKQYRAALTDVPPVQVLAADPPWKFGDKLPGKGRGAEKHYPTMTVEEICRFPVPPLDENCWLFLWRPATHQQEALDVAKAWGFDRPPSELIWRKTTLDGSRVHFGMGRAFRNAHETCLVFKRGKPLRAHLGLPSVFDAPRLEHSRKPDRFYELVDVLTGPTLRKAEVFARRQWGDWLCFGGELGKETKENADNGKTEGTPKVQRTSRDRRRRKA